MNQTPAPKTLAVALRYDAPDAPRVIAIGHGATGDRIIAAARKHGVPLEENPALAQALSRITLDDEIPPALYLAVAEIIGFLMRNQMVTPENARG